MRFRMSVVLSFILILTFLLTGCYPTPTPTSAPRINSSAPDPALICKNDAKTAPDVWDCSAADRKIIFRGVAEGVQAYNYPVVLEQLNTPDLTGPNKIKIIGLAGDIRFFRKDQLEVKVGTNVKLEMGITDVDNKALAALSKTFKDLFPIQTITDGKGGFTPWKQFRATNVSLDNNVGIITFDVWGGDAPTGWGSGGG